MVKPIQNFSLEDLVALRGTLDNDDPPADIEILGWAIARAQYFELKRSASLRLSGTSNDADQHIPSEL